MKLWYFVSFTFFISLIALCFEYDVFHLEEKRIKKLEKLPSLKKNQSFVLIIPSHNCYEVTEKTIQSILNQTYQNYRVILIDDGSDGSTFEKAQELLSFSEKKDRFTLLKNTQKKGSVECLYEAVQTCKDKEIVLFFEGDSWLAKPTSLEKINKLYKNYDIWLAYSDFENFRTKERSQCKAVSSQNFFHPSMKRKYWKKAKLKTFYAGLFKKIPIDYFFFRGKFISEAFDYAYMFPMMEMAHKHVGFIKDVLLFYVQKNISDDTRPCVRSPLKCNREIIKKSSFNPLASLQSVKSEEKKIDLIAFSYDRPLQLLALLESLQAHIEGLNQIFIIYRTSSDKFFDAYEKLKQEFPNVHFLHQRKKKEFQTLVHKTLFSLSSAPYIIFSVDDIVIKDKANVTHAVDLMEKTGSYFFSLRLGKHIQYCYMGDYPQKVPSHVHLEKDVIAWQVDSARGDWNYPHSLDMSIYRKNHLKKVFPNITFKYPNELEPAWEKYVKKHSRMLAKSLVGLSFTSSKAVNIPLNIVFKSANNQMNFLSTDELLEKFEEGLKIDIHPFFQMENACVHTDKIPIFIQRDS